MSGQPDVTYEHHNTVNDHSVAAYQTMKLKENLQSLQNQHQVAAEQDLYFNAIKSSRSELQPVEEVPSGMFPPI